MNELSGISPLWANFLVYLVISILVYRRLLLFKYNISSPASAGTRSTHQKSVALTSYANFDFVGELPCVFDMDHLRNDVTGRGVLSAYFAASVASMRSVHNINDMWCCFWPMVAGHDEPSTATATTTAMQCHSNTAPSAMPSAMPSEMPSATPSAMPSATPSAVPHSHTLVAAGCWLTHWLSDWLEDWMPGWQDG